MTYHLPECPVSVPRYTAYVKEDCICDRLRACEQRVTSRFAEYLRHMVDDDKFGQGVQAARDAVAALPISGGFTTPEGRFEEVLKADALAAIDALKGEQA